MTYQVKNQFQNLPFKCNPQRYSAAQLAGLVGGAGAGAENAQLCLPAARNTVGLCTLNQVDP
jgi:hypothetical protein